MLFLKYLLIFAGVGLAGATATILAYDIYLAAQLRGYERGQARLDQQEDPDDPPASSLTAQRRPNRRP
jgi:hypothetical protein